MSFFLQEVYSGNYVQNKKLFVSRGVFFLMLLVLSFIILFGFKEFPTLSLLVVDGFFCFFCTLAFKQNLRILFLLHPIVIWVLSLDFNQSFIQLGDGPSYWAQVTSSLSFYTGGEDFITLLQQRARTLDLLGTMKSFSIGVMPIFFVPDYIYGFIDDKIYYIWQSTMHVIFMSWTVVLAKKWDVMHDDYLFCVVLFAVMSPSFLELGCAPTRHYVTFLSIWLFYICFIALTKKLNVVKSFWFILSIFLIIISKLAYFLPISLFLVYYFLSKQACSRTFKLYLFIGLGVFALYCGTYLQHVLSSYQQGLSGPIVYGDSAGFSHIPVIGLVIKYIYALFAPFPWHKADYFISHTYGGSALFFILHIFSSLLGLYFVTRLVIFGLNILRLYPDLKEIVLYGVFISFSIQFGATGFHSYLSIVFPFFAPLFVIQHYSIKMVIPIIMAGLAEASYCMFY